MSEWKKRKQGTPAQVGKPFPVGPSGPPRYEPRDVKIFKTRTSMIPTENISKVESHKNVSNATVAYLQLMGMDPAFRSKSLFDRLEVLQEAFNLSNAERAQLVSSIEGFESDQAKMNAQTEEQIAKIESLAEKISLGSEKEAEEGLNELRKESPVVFSELMKEARR